MLASLCSFSALAQHDFKNCEATKYQRGIGTGNNRYNGHDCVIRRNVHQEGIVVIQKDSSESMAHPSRNVASETPELIVIDGKYVSPSTTTTPNATTTEPVPFDYADVQLPQEYIER